jgi:hypothetical protein
VLFLFAMTAKQVEAAAHQEGSPLFGEEPKRRQVGGRFSDRDADYLQEISKNNTKAVETCIAFRRAVTEACEPLEAELNRYMKANHLTALDRESQLRLLAVNSIVETLKQHKLKK